MKTRFSIIIPVYNVAPYLRECLDSVLAQTYTDWEAVCVDDGSTDGSGKILDEYAKNDSHIRVVHKANGGVSSARNRGLEEAKGEWILFLDGDDLWRPEVLATCAEMIKANPDAELVNFSRIRFPQDEEPQWPELTGISQVRDLDQGVIWDDLRYSFCTFAYRSDLVKSTRFPKYVVGEDLLFRAKALMNAKKIVTTEDVLFAYRTRIGSVSNSKLTWRKYSDRMKYLVQWLGMVLLGKRRQPKGLAWRLTKDLIRAVVAG